MSERKGLRATWSVCLTMALALVLSMRVAPAQGIVVNSEDGTALEMSAQGQVMGMTIGEAKLPLAAPGGFAIADYQNQPEPVNLVPNPGFEEGAQGWALGRGQTIDEEIVHSGKRAVRIEVPGPEPGNSNVGCLVPVKPNTHYRCELWVRREKVGVCGAYVSERDDQNKLTGKRTQVGAAIPKVDNQWHRLTWDLTTQPETTRLSLRSDIYRSTGTLWLDDFSITEANEGVYRPIEAKAAKQGDGVVVRGGLPAAGLELEATFTGGDECIRVEGMVRDTTGEDRAVGVRFALPLNAEGWTWYTDAEEHETVAAGGAYRHTYNCESGIGVCSIYPWSALSGPDAGLTLALPLYLLLRPGEGRRREPQPRPLLVRHLRARSRLGHEVGDGAVLPALPGELRQAPSLRGLSELREAGEVRSEDAPRGRIRRHARGRE